MKRLVTCVLLLTVFALSHARGAGAAEVDSLRIVRVDSTEFPQVSVVINLPEELADDELSSSSFTVEESGSEVRATARALDTETLDVVLLVDVSGSMRPVMEQAKDAAQDFIAAMPASTRFSVVAFSTQPTVVAPPGSDAIAARSAIESLEPAGETALYDGLTVAAGQLANGGSVVLLSDGGDTASQASQAMATEILRVGQIDLYAISLVTSESNVEALEQITTAIGGASVSVGDAPALGAVYGNVATQLTHRYELSYTSKLTRDAELSVTVEHGDVRASASATIDAPDNATPSLTPKVPAPKVDNSPVLLEEPSGTQAPWALTAGAAAFFVTLLVLGWMLTAPGERKRPRRRLSIEAGIQRITKPQAALTEVRGRAADFAERTLEKRGQRRSLSLALERGGIPMRPGEFVVLVGAIALGVGMVTSLIFGANFIIFLIVTAVVILGSRSYVSFKANQRRELFCAQLADTLQVMSGHLRTGYGLLQAVDVVASESDEPTCTEFRRLVTENRLGRDMGDALRAMSARLGSEDFDWVVQAIEVHRDVGGDLAEVLDNVATTIRDRDHVRRQVQALSADGRMSAYVLIALPFVVFFGLKFFSPDYMDELFTSTAGKLMLGGAVVLMGVGASWIRRVVRLQF